MKSVRALSIAAFAVGAILGVLAFTSLGSSAFAYALSTMGLSAPVPQETSEGRYQEQDPVLTLYLRPTGPEKREISIPAGSYWLHLVNATGIEEDLTVDVLAADRQTVLLSRTLTPRRRDLVHLPPLEPGEFYLVERSHPRFAMHVVVTP